jgi:hypothetical protein
VRKPRSMRPVNRHESLHVQGDAFRQLKYIANQANAFVEGLDDLIAATQRCAPVRLREPYPLVRDTPGSAANEEARWERAIWSEWHVRRSEEFIPGVCTSIVSYQVMLRDSNKDARWGEVDLLGRSPEGAPVVIELKGASSKESPLRGIAEGVAYAIAIRHAWGQCFGRQWCQALHIDEDSDCIGGTVFAAPADYWERVTGQRGAAWRVPKAAWQPLVRLIQALSERQLPVSLVRLDADDPQLPKGIRGSLLDSASFV